MVGKAEHGAGGRDRAGCCLLGDPPTHSAGVLQPNKRRESEPDHGLHSPSGPRSQWGVPASPIPARATRGPEALTDVLCEDDAGQASGLGQAGLHHRPPGALLLLQAQRLDTGHLRPGRRPAAERGERAPWSRCRVRAATRSCPRLTARPASASFRLWRAGRRAPLLGTGSAHPSPSHRSRDTWQHPYVQQSWQDNSLQLEITISEESAYWPQGGGQARCPLISRLGRAHGSFPDGHLRPQQALQTQSPPAGTMRPGTTAQHTQGQGYVKAGRRAGKRSS